MSPPAGDLTLDPGRGMAWVDEHGAHLVDYASCHLEPAPMLAAVIAALESCAARERPGNVSDRALLLSALRRECATGPGRGFLPGPGSGGPDPRAVRRAWSLADSLGAEALRLLYRHELPLRDLVYVLALPVKEAGRLIARTQDVVEILVSGLDGLARNRPICPELGPLAADVFPDEHAEAADFGTARTTLLRHIVTCVVCKRPINIRYTVPQILSRPPVADLTADTRQRILDALGRAGSARADRSAHRPPSSFGVPLAAPVNTAPVNTAPVNTGPVHSAPVHTGPVRGAPGNTGPAARHESPPVSVPPPRTVARGTPTTSPDSDPPTAVPREEPGRPSRDDTTDRHDRAGTDDREHAGPGSPVPPPQPGTARPSGAPPGLGLPERPVRPISQEDTQPGLAWPPRASRSRAAHRPAPSPGPAGSAGLPRSPEAAGMPGHAGMANPAQGPAAALPPGQDTPLYNALLSQIREREALARAAEAVPAPADGSGAIGGTGVVVGDVPDAQGEAESGRPLAGTQIRIVQVLARVGTLLRATALRIIIVVVAGAAGTVTGINLFAPAPPSQKGALEANAAQTSADPTGVGAGTAAGPTAGAAAAGGDAASTAGTASGAPQATVTAAAAQPGDDKTAGDATGDKAAGDATGGATKPGGQDTPVPPGGFLMGAWGVQPPSAITLDAFGQGTLTLSTTSGKPVKWRISAPGLVVEPSSGTLKPGHTAVLTVRALRVRYWCGAPSPVSAPVELHGPKGKGTATVRWSTC
ncbi:hypothetical protein [Microbispora sp. H11081]|uniref:hypothetical protein n=1 Tax=Microbispora sp. H11081 TaxID=2729107 RepID=UPI001B8B1F1F|nr:hypothetical protein [Microbispora sp. H11081]